MNKSKLTHEQLMASSLGGELKPFKRIRLMEIVPRPGDNLMQYLYFVTFEDPDEDMERLRIMVQLVERPGIHPPLIHTDAFIEHYQKQLPLYAKQPSRKVTTFHCIAEARTCDLAEEIPEEQKESMIRLAIKSHPFNPTIFNAYLNKKSPLMEHIGNSKSFPYTESRFCVMSFRWNTSNPEYPYIELTDIVGTGWEK